MRNRPAKDNEQPPLKPDPIATAAAGQPVIVDTGGIEIPATLCGRKLGRFIWKRAGRGFRVTEI
jgi:hypothetical protein